MLLGVVPAATSKFEKLGFKYFFLVQNENGYTLGTGQVYQVEISTLQ